MSDIYKCNEMYFHFSLLDLKISMQCSSADKQPSEESFIYDCLLMKVSVTRYTQRFIGKPAVVPCP